MSPHRHARIPFTEKSFYLEEFRGRSAALVGAAAQLRETAPLRPVLDELAANGTPVLIVSEGAAELEALAGAPPLAAGIPRLEGGVWRRLQARPRLGILAPGAAALPEAARDVALRLRIAKVVWLDAEGGLRGPDGERRSFVDLDELRSLLRRSPPAPGRGALLRHVQDLLEAGVPAVNLCAPGGLAEELFTYRGSGTLFSAERYVRVRRLGLDDFSTAQALIERGVAEGYLAPRDEAQLDQVLANAFGAFVEGRHLAGIGALLREDGDVGELVSLYTLTRFLGEGIGPHLLRFALDEARNAGCRAVFARTTSERVGAFFEREGFEPVPPEALPESRWRHYDPARRPHVRCYRHPLAPAP